MPMNPLERKAELVRRGIKVVDVAASLSCSPSHVSGVLSGMARNRRVEEKIASLIGQDRIEVFGPLPSESIATPSPTAVA
jgi:hypothetical protein